MLSVIGVLAAGSILASGVSPAWAKDYPSWEDVVAARSSESASAAQVAEIHALLAQLESELAAAQAEAKVKGDAAQLAEEIYFEAVIKANELQAQADAASKSANDSQNRAGQLAAQLARTGSNDLTLNLLMNGDEAGDMLAMMGQAGKVSEQANSIYEKAFRDSNTAQSLTDQADVAKSVLEGLKVAAAAAFAEAQQASQAAEAAVAASTQHQTELEAQLAALTTDRAATEQQYQEGVAARAAEAARVKAAAEAEAAARAAAYAAQTAASRANPSAPASGGGSPAGVVNPNGWVKPAGGYISSGFGPRAAPVAGVRPSHGGTDLASGCNAPIYAAHAGTVIYAGGFGSYGNWVLIDNGDGIQTGYAHIVDGGIRVSSGQRVGAGQVIAYVGSTGASTGCHLHFEVRRNGTAVDPVPFMRGVGVSLG